MPRRPLISDMTALLERTQKGFRPGTVRTWKDGERYQKQANGTWTPLATPAPRVGPKATPPAATAPAATGGASAEPEAPHKGGIRGLLGKAWHAVTGPFHAAFKLATNKKARTEFKDSIKKSVAKEVGQTKALLGTLGKALTGQKVTKEERTAAINQTVDLAKTALLGMFAGHMAGEGIKTFVATLASPLDEMAGIMIDGPLRRATKKIFGHEHGILPSSFYDDSKKEWALHAWAEAAPLEEIFGFGKKKSSGQQELLDKLMDALFTELAKEGLNDDDISAALSAGASPAQIQAIAQKLKKLAESQG